MEEVKWRKRRIGKPAWLCSWSMMDGIDIPVNRLAFDISLVVKCVNGYKSLIGFESLLLMLFWPNISILLNQDWVEWLREEWFWWSRHSHHTAETPAPIRQERGGKRLVYQHHWISEPHMSAAGAAGAAWCYESQGWVVSSRRPFEGCRKLSLLSLQNMPQGRRFKGKRWCGCWHLV